MRIAALWLALASICGEVSGQELVPTNLNHRIGGYGNSAVAMYRLGKGNTAHPGYQSGRNVRLKLPVVKGCRSLSYGHHYTQVLGKDASILLVQAELADSSRLIYADRNDDYDLRNDGPPLRLPPPRKGRDTVELTVYAPKSKTRFTRCTLSRLKPEFYGLWKDMMREVKGHPLAPQQLWLEEVRLNILEIPWRDTVSVYLSDASFDGYWGTRHDQIAIQRKGLKQVQIEEYHSPTKAKVGTNVKSPNGGWYTILALDTLTGALTLGPGKPAEGLYIGSTLQSLRLPVLSDTNTIVDIKELVSQAEYTVVDIWGSWCQGCVMAMPSLDSLHRQYSPRLQILGISTAPQMDSAFLAEHPYLWRQFELTEQGNRYLHPVTYPTYLLFNQEGRLIEVDPDLKRLMQDSTPPAR